ncbi:UDP-N-acetylmuramoyl-L-alanyl-D-glutamate--2,6-diaminopimelate ligase [Lewinella sp. 4G2]|uniref:UDP-N-acetylmuramoyl-L-alanyl-D-glutamate--2, 6-diaminopimelate ligase n=1 Tax=Lewinella sp. 4G2 TaxID=1803372 RepID=UPI0007B4E720|nr:UDP-N-acetylmuramoyl-L-alanyl-D-glutamate--2,6-diaminopimelate ligase [Lewinella sp. 4G2]OAV44778.1 UDP-N-acetylmuramoyl-L-alanyl-D-glutamate--2,6-diaminopimelate ligase [Lewinella sp. 4G2]
MLLTQLVHRLQDLSAVIAGEPGVSDREVSSVVFDSRQVQPGSLFVAVKGTQVDGHDYIGKAIDRGAIAIVGADAGAMQKGLKEQKETKDGTSNEVTFITVEDSAKALALAAAEFYGNPSQDLTLIGVTGTNGKTTVTTLLHDLFTDLGYKAGLLSTVEVRIGTEVKTATHTTPDAVAINANLAEMLDAGCTYVFMEVSSHAVDQQRTVGLAFDGGAFTNLSHDHLDYHETFRAYLEAKKAFFDGLPKTAFALSNADDKNGPVMLQNTRATKRFYSLRKVVDYRARLLTDSPQGLQLELDGTEIFTRLLGRYNAYNLTAVFGIAMELGMNREETLVSLSNLTAPNGRMENVVDPTGQVTAIVDYAHTPDALQNILETLAAVRQPGAQLICVVGAGGDRDKSKRPEMARIAAQLSDRVILTSDNPRTESAESILDDMSAGLISPASRASALRITDRRSAIQTAVQFARAGDIVLVAGKGHETYQDIQGVKHPFDDKVELTNALNLRLHAS